MTMQLNPQLSPGRATCKAPPYAPEVRRLRAEGYTFEAIRQTLLAAGISVSTSKIRREAGRPPNLWALDQAHELLPSVEHVAPLAQVEDATGEHPEGRHDHHATGPFPDLTAAMREFCRPR